MVMIRKPALGRKHPVFGIEWLLSLADEVIE
jgi:hypothetical protein